MKILIAAIHYPVASGRYLQRALTRLGHDVRTVGPATGNQIWGITVDEKWAWHPDMMTDERGKVIGVREGLAVDDGWLADLVITADSAFSLTGSVHSHVCLGQDNHVRDYQFPGVTFDALFLAHSWGARMGEPNAYWLPPCYDLEMCHDLGQVRDLDVGIMAVGYPNRIELVKRFAASGLPVAAGVGLLYDDYRDFYNRVKISLVRSIMGDLTNRFFESMAMGCCVLADRPRDAEKLGFLAGVDYWPYSTPEEAVHEAKWLLRTGKWEKIAANGKKKVLGHSWDDRAAKMLETVFAREAI